MEQDSRTMSLMLKTREALGRHAHVHIYGSNFTEDPGIYIEFHDNKEFIPSHVTDAEFNAHVSRLTQSILG